mgnify:CR=1 FL=1
MVSESTLTLDILPLSADTARLVRVYGTEPCIALPGTLPAPEGGSFAVTELGDYCFSEKPRSLPAADKTCRYEAAPDGTARLIRAFGQTVGGTCRRYDFDFDAPAAGSDADDLHPVCGNFLEELTLPDSLQVVGSCAFYNCRKLRLLTVGTGSLTMGSDVFLNCFALETIRVQAGPEEPTGLFALVNNITETVRAEFCPAGAAAPLAALWYPAYWEDIEETPAHILLHTFSGQGYHYRQCFLDNKFLPAEYDAIFPQGHDADDAAVMAMLCFGRLRYPWQLTEAAAGHYRAFLAANTDRVFARLLKAQDTDSIRALLALDVLDKAAFAEGAALAAKAENAAAAALLADAEHKKFAAAKPKRRHGLFYDDALIFDQVEAKAATLLGPMGYGVRVEYQDMANLLVWSAENDAPFVALEPWSGISHCTDEDGTLEHRRGVTVLQPGETATFGYKITMLSGEKK